MRDSVLSRGDRFWASGGSSLAHKVQRIYEEYDGTAFACVAAACVHGCNGWRAARANVAPSNGEGARAMQLRIFTEPQEGASYEQQLAVAQAAEMLGFDAFFRSDHLHRIAPGSPLPGPTDSWVTLGAIARETSTIRLGTLVTSATFRLPGPPAIAVAQVDEMSRGPV